MEIIIRIETDADLNAIREVTTLAFSGAAHSSGNEAVIIDELRDSGELTISLVAELAGSIVGHAAVSPVTISDGSTNWFGLGPISVLPEFQRHGIGSRLMRALMQRLQSSGAAGCVVLGDPGFYGRFGFRTVEGLILPGVPPMYFQACTLNGPVPQGNVSYAEAFRSDCGDS